jgi:hypothetical protein
VLGSSLTCTLLPPVSISSTSMTTKSVYLLIKNVEFFVLIFFYDFELF